MTVPSVLILGSDVAIAAAPVTPVQLAHACRAAGYDAVIPASWGDELVAARAIERLAATEAPLVHCSCPHVSDRLQESGNALDPLLIRIVPPPVAAAEYIRALYSPVRPKVTFAGGCPGANHASIDVAMSADALLASLEERGIIARQQPTEFDSVIPPDRRRFYSEPGGVPSRQALRQFAGGIDLVELRDDDVVVDLAQQLLQKTRVLIDASLPLGCCCSGKVKGVAADAARPRVRELEPPRAPSPVVDHSVRLSLDTVPPVSAPRIAAIVVPEASARPAQLEPDPKSAIIESEEMDVVETFSRRRASPGSARPVLGTIPIARTDSGRSLPRAYVARRRTSPTGVRRIEASSAPEREAARDDLRRWAIAATMGVVLGLIVAWVIRSIV